MTGAYGMVTQNVQTLDAGSKGSRGSPFKRRLMDSVPTIPGTIPQLSF